MMWSMSEAEAGKLSLVDGPRTTRQGVAKRSSASLEGEGVYREYGMKKSK